MSKRLKMCACARARVRAANQRYCRICHRESEQRRRAKQVPMAKVLLRAQRAERLICESTPYSDGVEKARLILRNIGRR